MYQQYPREEYSFGVQTVKILIKQENSDNCRLPHSNTLVLEIGQRSRSRHGTSLKGLFKDHACQISMLYHEYFRRYEAQPCLPKFFVIDRRIDRRMNRKTDERV